MKRAALIFIFAFVGVTRLIGAEDEEESSNTKPDAGGIVIEPSQGNITPGDEITITFPTAMVAGGSDRCWRSTLSVCERAQG